MTNVFLTGDAYASATYPSLVMLELLRARNAGHNVVAVDFPGFVPMLVQDIARRAGVELTLVKPLEGEDLDTFHQATLDAYDLAEVVMIHDEAMVSTVYQSLDRVVPDDLLRLVTTADLLV